MNHIAAIHVLKGLLKLQEDDYRALLNNLVGKTSCKAMTTAEQAKVRTHMTSLAERMRRPWTPDASVAEALLSQAADTQADLVVMGGYGHPRAWELVLGGVTRTLLL